MHIVAIGWAYVVLMMVLAEALGPGGSVLGAFVTLLLYGVLPLGIVLYIGGARGRGRRRRAAESAAAGTAASRASLDPVASADGVPGDAAPGDAASSDTASGHVDPGGRGQPTGQAVPPVREET
jgi:hypothetical protein